MANNVDLVMRLLAEDKASAAFKKVGAEAGKTGKSYESFGKKARNALLTVGVGAFAASSIKAFAEVQDASSALTATYGKTGEAFISWANNSADAMNLSKREALAAAQSFALFGKAAGLSGKQLESYVTPLVERAADAASYFGGTAADAVEAFSAALRGEMEPARKYGVLLDDMTLRTKALSMGLIKNVKTALTPQQKALAAQALILEQTAQVQGDVSRTSDSMANKIKDASQQFDDLKVSVGETLSVAVGPMLSVLNSTVGAFNSLPQPIKSVAIAVGVAGGAFLFLAPKVAAAKVALAEFGLTTKVAAGEAVVGTSKFSRVLGGIGKSLPVIGTALALGGVALEVFGGKSEDAAASQKMFADALEMSNGALDENVRKTVAKKAEDSGLLEQGRKLGLTEAQVVDAILGDAAARQKVTEVTRTAIGEQTKFNGAVRAGQYQQSNASLAAQAFRDKMAGLGASLDAAAGSQSRVNSALGATTVQAKAVQTSWENLRKSFAKPINGRILISVRANGDVAVNSGSGGGRGIVPTNAAGGEAPAGRTRWVGEFGPELFTPSTSGRIIPNSSARAMTGGTAETARVNVYLDGKQVQTSLVSLKRNQGGTLAF